MGVPRQNLTVEVPGRDLSSGEFAAVFPITTDPSVLPAAGNQIPASGANFSNPSVDLLLSPDPLPLLGPEELPNWQVNFETVPLQEVVLPLVEEEEPPPNGLPSIGVNAAVRMDDEDLANGILGSLDGSDDPGPTPLNAKGVLSHDFGSNGGGTVLLLGDGAPAGFAYVLNAAGTQLTILQNGNPNPVLQVTLTNATGGYEVTQLGPIVHPPGFGENDVAFAINYRVTDANGDFIDGVLPINVDDDTPAAAVDSGNVTEGSFLTVAASGVLSNDVAGADGFAAGGGVVGVRAAGGDLTTDVTTGVNTLIPGLHGTLVLQANGGYIYQSIANNITADTTDVFVYTVKDADGDLSTTTLTINLANVTVSVTDTDALVNEAGLPIGSNAASDSEIFNGSITPSGGTGPYTFTLNSPATGSHGTLLLNAADGTYTYTLTSPFDTTPDSTTTATQTEQNKDSFSYTVTDANGATATGTILVDIVDDVPQANDDGTFTVTEGTPLLISTALDNDLAGADGVDPATGVAVTTAAAKGVAVYNGDGTFTYTATAGQEGLDTFVYTITDQDGDTSTATVTVDLGTDSVPSLVGSASNLTVDEDGFGTAAVDTVTARTDETDSTESLTATGTAVVNFGSDVPANLLGSIVLVDTPALDGQLQTHDGQSVTFALEANRRSGWQCGSDRGHPHSSGERGRGSWLRAM